MQSRLISLIEVLVNIGIGFLVAFIGAILIYPLFGMEQPTETYFWVTVCFTALSIIRAYIVRRYFNGPFDRWLRNFQNANKD